MNKNNPETNTGKEIERWISVLKKMKKYKLIHELPFYKKFTKQIYEFNFLTKYYKSSLKF